MKIGILTFFHANNYGAVLQAFSLQKKLESLGYQAECIDYRCLAIERRHRKLPLNLSMGISKLVKNVIRNYYFHRREKGFTLFRDTIPHSIPFNIESISKTNDNYDVFITGSDQVFNLNLTDNDETFFLPFVRNDKMKVAYAASMGKYLEDKENRYKELLTSFKMLSVREKTAASQIRENLLIDCLVMPDPVFLYSGDEWKNLLGIDNDSDSKPYLLIYSLYGDALLFEAANKVANDLKVKIVLITKMMKIRGKYDKLIRNADPIEFIKLFTNARYVLTDSFHGTCFSIILNKDFNVVLPPHASERILDILEELKLKDRIVNEYTDAGGTIKYDEESITNLRNRGIDFLKNIRDLKGNVTQTK